MKWGVEILSPSSCFSNSTLSLGESRGTGWTQEENKAFENALAMFDENTPDRWRRVAEMVPGKTVGDVMRQYKDLEYDVSSIEAGLIPVPGYTTSLPFTLEWGGSHVYDGSKRSCHVSGGRKSGYLVRSPDQERKKGVPWTEEEHKLFLMGLKKYGKGDWRNISRNFVITRTPTQVASHAQKYFIRQLSGGKDKRRASIHDITTVDLSENQTLPPDNKKLHSPEQPNSTSHIHELPLHWKQTNRTIVGFNPGNILPYGSGSYGLRALGQNLSKNAVYESCFGSQNLIFQMQSGIHYPNA